MANYQQNEYEEKKLAATTKELKATSNRNKKENTLRNSKV